MPSERKTDVGTLAIDDAALLAQHIEALFVHDAAHRLIRTNDITGRTAPRFYLGRTRSTVTWRFRNDLPTDVIARLESLCREEPTVDDLQTPPLHDATYRALLDPVTTLWSGPAFRFPHDARQTAQAVAITTANRELLRGAFDDWLEDVAFCQPFVALVVRGRAAALCASVRITPAAHEAGVETADSHRGKGLAPQVVAAWAQAVRLTDAIPLYSTSWTNRSSQRVAAKLGLVVYGSDYHIL